MPTFQRRGRGRHWTTFELTTVVALICQGAHLERDALLFATKLNEALNGRGSPEKDIPVDDVYELLAEIELNHQAALCFVERQPIPRVITRQRKLVLLRSIAEARKPDRRTAAVTRN